MNSKAGYQPDLNGVKVWNPQPAEEETVLWEGPVTDDMADGAGLLTWYWRGTVVSTYRGAMKAGKPHGTGRYEFADGDIYEGTWENGLRHGSGKQWYQDGSYYEGVWHMDKRV